MIPIYEQEIHDGLAQVIEENTSIAFITNINQTSNDNKSIDLIDNHPKLAIAGENDQWDLFCFNSILVSVGWNKNDDVFDPTELWLARSSPVFKKVNFQHDEKDIIGVITACIPVDFDNKILSNDTDKIPEKFDLVTSSALYKRWKDETLQERMDNLIEAIGNNELFVSMEVLFRKFDYTIQDSDGGYSIIPRTHNSAYLTKHLRAYGGSGVYDGKKLGRMPRNCTFSGQGIVYKPANPRSIILNSKASIMENKMADTNDMVRKDDLVRAEAKIAKLEETLEKQVAEAQKLEREKLEKEIARYKLDNEDVTKQLTSKASELASKETELEEVNKQLKAKETELSEARAEIAKIQKAQKRADRLNKLIGAGVEQAKADKLVDKWESVSDEQFDDVVELNKATAAPIVETKAPEVVPEITEASVDKEAALNVKPDDQVSKLQTATAAWMAGFLGKNNDKLTKK